ncbi:hypothetical protein CTI14_41040 [Methylobacterium radiotolerans]|nr:hypothetical protein CTI14_41040 [Methylobacterium radiotolerans]
MVDQVFEGLSDAFVNVSCVALEKFFEDALTCMHLLMVVHKCSGACPEYVLADDASKAGSIGVMPDCSRWPAIW